MVGFLIAAVVTAVSLLIISKLPFLGVEVDSPWKALISGFVIGILNFLLWPLIAVVNFPLIKILSLGILSLIVSAIIFGLAAWLIEGFRLRNGIVSAILGAIALGIVNSIVFYILGALNLI